ncbi:hypothetical protein KAK06_00535 [Ideonella sp. 4Y11]|uniref:Uncharacterized protein n=1 Tax=Ideonella aquatica TaxID=2824119 RepID=A0A940YQ55_9BURK|nr:hypothetical protein [Ideonella aquatica]MBQ0957430.1 hypothetical protein [Ideonella aquatica]
MDALTQLTDRAFAIHAQDAAGAAAMIADGLPATLDQADSGSLESALRAIEHIGLGHLADGDWVRRMMALVAPLQARAPSLAVALARGEAALALLAGDDPDLALLPPAERVRAHANPALGRARQGDIEGARRLLDLATARAAEADTDPPVRRAIAALANNLASDIRDTLRSPADPAAVALMLEAATRSRAAWSDVGGWLEVERADWLLAMCHASAGQGHEALRHAQATLAACQVHGGDDFEFCFAWQAMAFAALAARDRSAAQQARTAMAERAERLSDAGDQQYARDQLALIDAGL